MRRAAWAFARIPSHPIQQQSILDKRFDHPVFCICMETRDQPVHQCKWCERQDKGNRSMHTHGVGQHVAKRLHLLFGHQWWCFLRSTHIDHFTTLGDQSVKNTQAGRWVGWSVRPNSMKICIYHVPCFHNCSPVQGTLTGTIVFAVSVWV